MALLKSTDAKEIAELQKIEKRIRRRERIHHLLIGGLSVLLLASLSCHVAKCVDCKRKKHLF